MQGTGKIIALVSVAAVALSALSSVINNVHVVPVFNQGGGGQDGDGRVRAPRWRMDGIRQRDARPGMGLALLRW